MEKRKYVEKGIEMWCSDAFEMMKTLEDGSGEATVRMRKGEEMEEGKVSIRINITINEEVRRILFELMEYYREPNRSAVVRRAISHLYREEERSRRVHETK